MAKGFFNSIIQFIKKLFSRKPSKSLPGKSRIYAKTPRRKGVNLDCNIAVRYAARSSQSKRRKMARRTGRVTA